MPSMGTDIFPQTTVDQYPAAGFPGQLYDPGNPTDLVSAAVSESGGVDAGVAVMLDTAQAVMLPGYVEKVKYPTAGAVVYGWTVLQIMKQPSSPRFALKDVCAVLRKGRIFAAVSAAGAVSQNDDVFVTITGTKGLVQNAPGLGVAIRVPGVKVLKAGPANGVCIIDVNLPEPLDTTGGIATVTAVKTSAYTPAFGEFVNYDTTGGAFTVTLPEAQGNAGRVIQLNNASASTTALTVATTNGETINGSATQSLTTARPFSRTFRSDGANWYMY
jgi:hypothetical protein